MRSSSFTPVFEFCLAQLNAATSRPLVIGLQAPQGAGKTTLGANLLHAFAAEGARVVSVSIDDFYLTRAEQLELAAAHPGNPYLEHRGYPGTHDLALGDSTLTALKALRSDRPGGRVKVPVYDKSQHGGRGDRLPESAWRVVEGPLDLVILEGWMLGYVPIDEAALPDPQLAEPNRLLAGYERWLRLLDAFVVIRGADPDLVLSWRVQAEDSMRARGLPALDRPAIEDYVRRFLPAYRLYGGAPPGFPSDKQLTITIDAQRRPLA